MAPPPARAVNPYAAALVTLAAFVRIFMEERVLHLPDPLRALVTVIGPEYSDTAVSASPRQAPASPEIDRPMTLARQQIGHIETLMRSRGTDSHLPDHGDPYDGDDKLSDEPKEFGGTGLSEYGPQSRLC